LEAVKQNEGALQYADQSFLRDMDIIMEARKQNPRYSRVVRKLIKKINFSNKQLIKQLIKQPNQKNN